MKHFRAPKQRLGRKTLPGAISEADRDRFWRVSDTLGGSKIELPCRREANFLHRTQIEKSNENHRFWELPGSTWDGPGTHFAPILKHFRTPKQRLGRKTLPESISEADRDRYWRVSDTLGGSKIELPCRREANFPHKTQIEKNRENHRFWELPGSTWEGPGAHFGAILERFGAPKQHFDRTTLPGAISAADRDRFLEGFGHPRELKNRAPV